jgi:hypothetical protein
MQIVPRGIAATGLPACYIDYIFNNKAQSIQQAAAGRRQLKRGYESIALSDTDCRAFHFRQP